MRGKDVRLALNIEPLHKHIEGTRAKPKRMAERNILTEDKRGVFTFTPKRT